VPNRHAFLPGELVSPNRLAVEYLGGYGFMPGAFITKPLPLFTSSFLGSF
jgi:hypothetical protein